MMDRFMTQILVLVKPDFQEIANIKASVQDKIYINDITLPVEKGDIFEYMMPSGLKRTMHVTKVNLYNTGSRLDHYEIDFSEE